MNKTETTERFSRQVILPGVGPEGQAKWASASVLLAGEGPAFEAAKTALESAGLSNISMIHSGTLLPAVDTLTLVLTGDAKFRRQLSRELRARGRSAIFAWAAGSGYALFPVRHGKGNCPCFECFEVMNPKAFAKGSPSALRLMGAAVASEALQWILKEDSPLEGKVWLVSPDSGSSFHHTVPPTPKCHAKLSQDGAKVTP